MRFKFRIISYRNSEGQFFSSMTLWGLAMKTLQNESELDQWRPCRVSLSVGGRGRASGQDAFSLAPDRARSWPGGAERPSTWAQPAEESLLAPRGGARGTEQGSWTGWYGLRGTPAHFGHGKGKYTSIIIQILFLHFYMVEICSILYFYLQKRFYLYRELIQ